MHFCNVDDKFHCLERRSQHMICKLEWINLFSFHVKLYALYFMIFNFFRHHAFDDSWGCFEVLQMEQPHIILWWYVIEFSWGGAKERSIVSLIITSFVSACLAPSKPPSPDEAMSSLWYFRMEYSSKSFGTLRFTPCSVSVTSKVSQTIGDSRKF